jgi:hypothetical protein
MSQAAQRKAAQKRQKRQNRSKQRRANGDGRARMSLLMGQKPSPLPDLREAKIQEIRAGLELLDSLDSMAGLRHALSHMAAEKDEWAGIPMLLDGLPLVIEPTYPYAKLGEFGKQKEDENALPKQFVRNIFYSMRLRANIAIWTEGTPLADGVPVYWGVIPNMNHMAQEINTLSASDAWSIESESKALCTLAELLPHRSFKQYLLTGSFLWTSPKSRVHYLFRKLRPTVALADDGKGNMRILAALCQHPIAYYEGSWAGAMTPSDDIIAHFSLCRADEHMFWRRSNQHPAWTMAAGI